MKIDIVFSPEFLETLSECPKDIQKKAIQNIVSFQKNQSLASLHFHKLKGKINDKSLHAISVHSYRIVMYTEDDTKYHLLWIDNHDDSYDMKNNVQEIRYANENPVLGNRDYYSSIGLTKIKTRKIFDEISPSDLEKMGVPKDKIKLVKNTPSIYSLSEILKVLPPDVSENLELLASGEHVKNVLKDMERQRCELLGFLEENVLTPAEESKLLDNDIRESIKNTRERLESKQTLKEVLDFYFDALKAKRGKELYAKFQKANLKSFEDFEDEIKKRFVLYNPANV